MKMIYINMNIKDQMYGRISVISCHVLIFFMGTTCRVRNQSIRALCCLLIDIVYKHTLTLQCLYIFFFKFIFFINGYSFSSVFYFFFQSPPICCPNSQSDSIVILVTVVTYKLYLVICENKFV